MKLTIAVLAAAMLAPIPATAQSKAADRDIYGHLYCYIDGADLRQTGDGGYKVDIGAEWRGDIDHAVYPAGSARLFGEQGALRAYVAVNYQLLLDASGMPRGRPAAYRMSVSTGRFAGSPVRPVESLELRVKGGSTFSRPIGISASAFNSIAVVTGDVGLTGSENPYDTEMPASEMEDLLSALDNGERWIVLTQSGREIARIPVPNRDMAPERNKAIAWVRATVPLLAKGKCS